MGHYLRIVINKPLPALEPALLTAFDTDGLLPPEQAGTSDLLIRQGSRWTALDDNDSIDFFTYVSMDPEPLRRLSELADAEVRAIAAETGMDWVDLLVVDRGRIIRRYNECHGQADVDEGELPGWEGAIRNDAWNVADKLVGLPGGLPRCKPDVLDRLLVWLGWWKPSQVDPASEPPMVDPILEGMDFGEPTAAISLQRFHDRMNREAAKLSFRPVKADVRDGVLQCELDDGTIVKFNRADLDRIMPDPFWPGRFVLKFMDGRTVYLPEGANCAAIWVK